MTLSFPSSPDVGDYYTPGPPGSRVWRWNGTLWEIVQPVQFAKVGNRVETITPNREGHIRLLDGPVPIIITFLLSAVCAFGQATVSKVMVDVKMSDGKFQERELTPSADQYIGFDALGALTVKAGGGISLAGTPDYLTLSGGVLTRNLIDLTTDVTGTLPVANGGTGLTTLTANNVLLGNGTSALQVVAPSTTGNVLTSNGTTWTSAAPTTGANPAGSGSELQFRSSDTAFGAVTGSTVSGGAVTLVDKLTITQGTANANVLQSTGYSLTGTNASSMIDLAGTWNTSGTPTAFNLNITDTASNAASNLAAFQIAGTTRVAFPKRGAITFPDSSTASISAPGIGNWAGTLGVFGQSGTLAATISNSVFNFNSGFNLSWGGITGPYLVNDGNYTLSQRNGSNPQILRIYEIDSGANDEYLEFSAASGTNLIRPQATGTGTASVVRYHTTTAVFWTSGSGSPESVVTAPVGSLYTRTDGGASTTLYVKESGTGSTGWVAK